MPLIERDGSRSGFIWADDPTDEMLPSRERLQALRTFANQATTALRAAVDLETATRRNTELGALHETTVALLSGIGIDTVLDTILSNAATLTSAPLGFLYLPSETAEKLELRAHRGFETFEAPTTVGRGQGVVGQVFETGETVLVEELRLLVPAATRSRRRSFHLRARRAAAKRRRAHRRPRYCSGRPEKARPG